MGNVRLDDKEREEEKQEDGAGIMNTDAAKKICAEAARWRERGETGEIEEKSSILRAEGLFREAVAKFPDFWMTHYGLGELLLHKASRARRGAKSFREEGIEELRKAVASAPNRPEPLLVLAAELSLHDPKTAIDSYRRATEIPHKKRKKRKSLYPGHEGRDHWQFAIGIAESGKRDLAVRAFRRAFALDASYERWVPEFEGDAGLQPAPKAKACWHQALKLCGKSYKKWWQFWVRKPPPRDALEKRIAEIHDEIGGLSCLMKIDFDNKDGF